jgi:hypothetical protein
MQQRTIKKPTLTDLKKGSVRRRLCKDCPEAEIHMTGSTLWVSCKLQQGWRPISAECNLPVNPIQEIFILEKNSIQGLYSSENALQSFWSLKARVELAVFREHKKGDTEK